MKKSISILMVCAAQLAFAQIAIGKASVTTIPATTTPNPSISLEFGDYAGPQLGKGIVLPWVNSAASLPTTAVSGTIIYDVNDKIVKYKVPTTTDPSGWKALSKNETTTVGTTTNFDTTGVVNTVLQNSLTELSDAKVNIGPSTSGTPAGILVLENANQAMILPKVASPHLNIINPEPGTMAYDTATKQIAVYNGKVWSFWKP